MSEHQIASPLREANFTVPIGRMFRFITRTREKHVKNGFIRVPQNAESDLVITVAEFTRSFVVTFVGGNCKNDKQVLQFTKDQYDLVTGSLVDLPRKRLIEA